MSLSGYVCFNRVFKGTDVLVIYVFLLHYVLSIRQSMNHQLCVLFDCLHFEGFAEIVCT